MFLSSKKKHLIIWLFAFILGNSFASIGRQITGQVLESEFKKPVRNANVLIFGTTVGTITNHLGFFAIEVEPDQNELVISSIGYQTSKIEIPQANQFKILLLKESIMLAPLDLGHFKIQNALTASGKLPSPNPNEKPTEVNAKYPGDWVNFYNDLSLILVKDSSHFLQDSIYQVQFSVDEEGLPKKT